MELSTLITTFVMAIGLAGMPAASSSDVESWVEAQQESRSPIVETLERDEVESAADALAEILRAARVQDAGALALSMTELENAGFATKLFSLRGTPCLMVNQRERGGDALIIIRLDHVRDEYVLQAPHSFHDLHTGDIALRTFIDGSMRAVFLNTAHRHHHSDVTHVAESFLVAASRAFLDAVPEGRVVQLHGFANEELAADSIEIVVSNGTRTPTDATFAAAKQLSSAFGAKAAVYGKDTRHYGATRNAVGKLTRDNPDRFVHIELSLNLRKKWNRVRPLSI